METAPPVLTIWQAPAIQEMRPDAVAVAVWAMLAATAPLRGFLQPAMVAAYALRTALAVVAPRAVRIISPTAQPAPGPCKLPIIFPIAEDTAQASRSRESYSHSL